MPSPHDQDAADDAYLAQHSILPLINDMVLALVEDQPSNVVPYLRAWLQRRQGTAASSSSLSSRLTADAFWNLRRTKVLVVGLGLVGAEVARHMGCARIHHLTLLDSSLVTANDLCGHLLLQPTDIRVGRATACAARLRSLFPATEVMVAAELTEEVVQQHDVMVYTQPDLREMLRWNTFCRTRTTAPRDRWGSGVPTLSPISFIWCTALGPLGSLFVDHGPGFVRREACCATLPLVAVRWHPPGPTDSLGFTLVTYDSGGKEDIAPEGLVRFEGGVGLEQLQASGPWRYQHHPSDGAHTMRLGDIHRHLPPAGGFTGGCLLVSSTSQPIPFRSLAECITHPGTMPKPQLHSALLAILRYHQCAGRLPGPEGAAECGRLAADWNALAGRLNAFTPGTCTPALCLPALDDAQVTQLAACASQPLTPVCTIVGALAAMEVAKRTGILTPLTQWQHISALGALQLPGWPGASPPLALPPRLPALVSLVDVRSTAGWEVVRLLGSLGAASVAPGVLHLVEDRPDSDHCDAAEWQHGVARSLAWAATQAIHTQHGRPDADTTMDWACCLTSSFDRLRSFRGSCQKHVATFGTLCGLRGQLCTSALPNHNTETPLFEEPMVGPLASCAAGLAVLDLLEVLLGQGGPFVIHDVDLGGCTGI